MPSYSQNSFAAAVGNKALSGSPSSTIAYRWYGEQAAATANRLRIVRCTIASVTVAPFPLNSLSPTAANSASVTIVVVADIMILGAADFSRGSWFPSFFASYIFGEVNEAVGHSTVNNPDACHIFRLGGESVSQYSRCRTRCRAKYGKFCIFGNEIHNHQKTGSGSFQIFAPHFDNDITWCDTSAWRNGSHQSDTWNINLFGKTFPRSVALMNGV